ncbi:hypothetical protein AAZX31_08G316600 [Glycine max]|uniref:DUF724 domain-containing protein 3 isoform A n=1 Tax=Glycine soja TaxID=3848 RepID=A0A445JN93_GLYSO|nr:uncharacterized protein LOC114423511 [Glycine soja]KAG5002084.1 hypothetical protein JHK87_023156 [Glycine soja]KHM99466.1 hypothetical protein glysoja_006309 [Glycine soja]RZB99936.1 DUF724 domain-containing protein 3 isoform A [Glycine soja]RZB99939.1 DUF724 domain-containing protein 3 isoform D [Glycine soja]
MAVNNCCFVEWKEQFVSQERGNRVVHYYLKDSAGESVLAVVGTERSVRHMCYVVAEEFLEICGMEGSIPTGFKWRSRREVVDWLTSTLSKQNLQGDRSVSAGHNLVPSHEATNDSVNEITGLSAQITDDKDFPTSNSKLSNSDIVWSGVAWRCGKQLKHYPAFFRNGIKIAIQSFVFVMGKGENHYIAYVEDMYEDRRGQKKIKVRWFHHNQEVKGVVPVRNPHPREVFITPYSQVISSECVDGSATVLTREDFEKCMPFFSPTSRDRIHLCFRQFRSNKIKPFDLSKLRGYYAQPILSCLHLDSIQHPEFLAREDEELSAGDDVKVGVKRRRGDKGSPQSWISRQGVRKLSRNKQMMVYKTFQVANYARSERILLSRKQVGSQPWSNHKYKVDDKIELLCQDSGIRGCWFRCTVVQVARKQLKVQYDDVQDEDGSGNLEEWIPSFKLARPDKLGMRHSGRPTIRPAPTYEEQELAVEVGSAVDAWWSDGWWEGVVTRIDNCGDDSVEVHFPGECLLMNVCKKDLRISRDWLGDSWINIKAKPEITKSIFTANNSFNTKLSVSPSIAKDVDSVGFANSCHGDPVSKKSNEPVVIKEENFVSCDGSDKEENFVSCDGSAEDGDCVQDNKPSSEKSTQADNIDTHINCDNEENCGDNDNDNNSNDGGGNKNDDDNGNKDMGVFGTSGPDQETVELMEVAV